MRLPYSELTTYGYDTLNRLTSVLEKQGTTTLFSQNFILNSDGGRASVAESQRQIDGSPVTGTTTWSYDALHRLTGESFASSDTPKNYANTFAYDLSGNRTKQMHTGPAFGAGDTITFACNGDDQLTKPVSGNGATITNFTYDPNGSQLGSTGAATSTYTYDVRNKMITARVGGGQISSYVYNDTGNRVQQITGGVTTYYLTDTQNPTGYAQPLEERSSATSNPTVTYLTADRTYGQVDSTGAVKYLLTDGHGSTRLMTNATGQVVSALNYDAFGGANGFMLGGAPGPFSSRSQIADSWTGQGGPSHVGDIHQTVRWFFVRSRSAFGVG